MFCVYILNKIYLQNALNLITRNFILFTFTQKYNEIKKIYNKNIMKEL